MRRHVFNTLEGAELQFVAEVLKIQSSSFGCDGNWLIAQAFKICLEDTVLVKSLGFGSVRVPAGPTEMWQKNSLNKEKFTIKICCWKIKPVYEAELKMTYLNMLHIATTRWLNINWWFISDSTQCLRLGEQLEESA